jgi:hypothetical protein
MPAKTDKPAENLFSEKRGKHIMGIGIEDDVESIWLEMDLIERGAFLDEDLFPADYRTDYLFDSDLDAMDSEMAY